MTQFLRSTGQRQTPYVVWLSGDFASQSRRGGRAGRAAVGTSRERGGARESEARLSTPRVKPSTVRGRPNMLGNWWINPGPGDQRIDLCTDNDGWAIGRIIEPLGKNKMGTKVLSFLHSHDATRYMSYWRPGIKPNPRNIKSPHQHSPWKSKMETHRAA